MRQGRVSIFLCLFIVGALLGPTPAFADYKPGSEIEVKEGDTWSKVKVITSEGRRVKVRYDDGTEEWVGPDRLKPANAGATPPAGNTAPNGVPATQPAKATRAFAVDQQVEIKRRGKWIPADIKEIAKGWVFVSETGDSAEKRWVETWAIRVRGSIYDIDDNGTDTWAAQPGQLPPKEAPKKSPPVLIGDPFTVASDDQRPPSVGELNTNAEPVTFDGTSEPKQATNFTFRPPTTQPSAEFAAWALRGTDNQRIGALDLPGYVVKATSDKPGVATLGESMLTREGFVVKDAAK